MKNSSIPAGRHVFALYQWDKQGGRDDFELVPVAEIGQLADKFLNAMKMAEPLSVSDELSTLLDDAAKNRLDAVHYNLWRNAEAEHKEQCERLTQYQLESLETSHKGRMQLLKDQINVATNEKIQKMKLAEEVNATADFERRVTAIRQHAATAAITARPVAYGIIEALPE